MHFDLAGCSIEVSRGSHQHMLEYVSLWVIRVVFDPIWHFPLLPDSDQIAASHEVTQCSALIW
jgi:hypothetical protein